MPFSRFTDARIKTLQPKAERYDIWEGHGDGLTVRVYPSGERSFAIWYTLGGRRRRMTLGRYPRMTLKDARAKAAEALALVERGVDPLAVREDQREQAKASAEQSKREPTIAVLVTEYLTHYARPRKKSAAEDERILEADVLPHWRNRKASSIVRRDVVLLLDKVVARGAPIMARQMASVLRTLFEFACRRGVLEANPAAGIPLPPRNSSRTRALSDAEISIVWPALEEAAMVYHTRQALRLVLLTGQRPGEVIGLPWSELDLEARLWRLPGERNKSGREHTIPLSGFALEIIESLRRYALSETWVFPSPRGDKPIGETALGYALRLSCKMGAFGDVSAFTPHDLRRTCRTGMERLGINGVVAERVLNHKLPGIVAVYNVHHYLEEMRHALEVWGEHVRELAGAGTAADNVVKLR